MRQAVYSRLAGYEDTNDADRLSEDPAMLQVEGKRVLFDQASSTSEMSPFETEILTQRENVNALMKLPGNWVDWMHQAQADSHAGSGLG